MLKGVSIYSGLIEYDKQSNIEYLNKIKEKNIDFIFTSLHIGEANKEEVEDFIRLIKDFPIPFVIDVSGKTYDKELLPSNIIPRLDYGFTIQNIKQMILDHDMIEVNASLVNRSYLETLKKENIDFSKIRVSYNFYPKPYTGLSIEDVKEKNELFKEYGLTVICYIPGSMKRPPVYKGLPSIESQRYQSIEENVSEAIALGMDGVCVGDAYLSDSEFDELLNTESITIKATPLTDIVEELEFFDKEYILRKDESKYFLRSSSTRGIKLQSHNTLKKLEKYLIVVDNINMPRYFGELEIIKNPIVNDGSMNVIGVVKEESKTLIDLIKGGQRIKFKL